MDESELAGYRSDLHDPTLIYLRAPQYARPLLEAFMDHLVLRLMEQSKTARISRAASGALTPNPR
jgi:hypothetical protein